ncbi:MAG: hypothetical protein WAQ53_05365 [Thiofilum sp.]|uniref:hypothetical protein n=1 Tax=Thiofilum sp. TaxID=2212733 RepID=UPI0025E7B33E|nr:hypothetical protein [Thiofilum sp.]MBK8452106.1 hypothetical protein [Thiofilum sp.]
MMRLLPFIPLFGIILLVYWTLVQFGIFPRGLNVIVLNITLPSGHLWRPTWGDIMVLTGIVALYVELFKSTRTSETTIADHLLSTIVLIFYLVYWLTNPSGGNSVFLILTCMSFLDVIAGFTITISSARRDLSIGGK